MQFADFWYVVAGSKELRADAVLARTVLGEWLAVFRGADGQPVALRDRCLHRHSRLSAGRVQQGVLHCPYHGWVYDRAGQVIAIPAAGESYLPCSTQRVQPYSTREQDGYIYVCLSPSPSESFGPFALPHYQEKGWQTVRVINRFRNTVLNCVENFIDIPHTVSVHPGIFRQPRQQQLEMTVERRAGEVWAKYRNETDNLGWYARFLNGQRSEIEHTDRFVMPNVTCVEYRLGPDTIGKRSYRHLFITSQAIPETADSTLVYTDITYNYGIWTTLARPFVWWTAQRIIGQDVEILRIQGETIAKYGTQFAHTPVDTIHCFVESIHTAIGKGEDPRQLPDQSAIVTFWV